MLVLANNYILEVIEEVLITGIKISLRSKCNHGELFIMGIYKYVGYQVTKVNMTTIDLLHLDFSPRLINTEDISLI